MRAATPAEAARELRDRLETVRYENSGPAKYQAAMRSFCGEMLEALEWYEQTRAAEHTAATAAAIGMAEAERERTERERQRADKAQARADELERASTNLREVREEDGEGSIIRLLAPRTVNGHPRDWQLAELENVCWRLRAGGANDLTEVRVKHEHTEARVPFPEAALYETRAARTIVADEDARAAAKWRSERIRAAVVVAVMLLGAAAFLGLFIL